MILVAGGTGRLGTEVVHRLVSRGVAVRVLTRDLARATHVAGPLVEVVHADVRDALSLEPVMEGITTVVSAVHGFAGPGGVTPASVDRDGNANLVGAASAAHASVVLLSIVGASPQHPMELIQMKAAAEANLRGSTTGWTIVRATAFVELWLELITGSAGRSGRPLIFGRGDNPINFVSVDDVAAVVEMAVVDPTLRGQVLEVGGPQNLTLNDLAALAQQRPGSSDKAPRHLPRPVLRAVAASGRVAGSVIARQAAMALVMDTTDMTFDAEPLHATHPHLPFTTVSGCSPGGRTAPRTTQ